MRKLISFNMMTLDGFFEGPGGNIDWHNADNAEFNEFAAEHTADADVLLFGRITYQMMASYWPTPDAIQNDPIVANLMNGLPKVVFSRTLTEASWSNSTLVSDNLTEYILNLKQQPGKDLAVLGSANLLATLMRLDLIDEHRVMVNPVLLGGGTPLFKQLDQPLKLKLVNTRTFRSGNVLLTYQPAKSE